MIFRNALCTLLARPSRKSVSKLRMLPHFYLDEFGHTSHSSWKGIISAILQARNRIITNLQQEIRDYVYIFLYPEGYNLTESIPTAAQAAKKSSTTVKTKENVSESCIRLQGNLKIRVFYNNLKFLLVSTLFKSGMKVCNKFLSFLARLLKSNFFNIETLRHFKVLRKYFK